MKPELWIEQLWREFKENTLEELKLLLLSTLTKVGNKTIEEAVNIVDAIRAHHVGERFILTIANVTRDLVHAVVCDENFCACSLNTEMGEIKSSQTVLVAFTLPIPPVGTDASWMYRHIVA